MVLVRRADEDFAGFFDEMCQHMRAIVLQKRSAYGTQNITSQGLQGVVARIAYDKLSRIQNEIKIRSLRAELEKAGMPGEIIDKYLPVSQFDSEKLEDNLIDVANYAIIALALLRGKWE